jgi:hypothetical protein
MKRAAHSNVISFTDESPGRGEKKERRTAAINAIGLLRTISRNELAAPAATIVVRMQLRERVIFALV